MATTVDTQTFDLGHGETASGTLTWDTATDDKGDWTATAVHMADLADSTAVRLVEYHERTVTAVSPGGSGSVSRTADAERTTTATGTGRGNSSRTTNAARTTLAAGNGAASVSRTADTARTTTAVSPGGDATVSRTASSSRTVTGYGSGAGTTSWTAPVAFAIPASRFDPANSPAVLLAPTDVDTDHDTISVSAIASASVVDELRGYESAGNVDREDTAFGAYRRIPRDGTDPITLTPPANWNPPFQERRVLVEGYDVSEESPGKYVVSFDFGLEEPRARSPPESDPVTKVVDERTVYADAGATTSTTLKWDTEGSDVGLWEAIASVENLASADSSASTSVTVTDSDFLLAFPVATLNLSQEDVRPIERGTNSGVPQLDLELTLDPVRTAIVFAVGSRVEAATVRSVPDGGNVVIDTLPDQDLTADLEAPTDTDIESGEYVLSGWSASRGERIPQPYTVTLSLLKSG